jgi:hypothetical protein
MVELHRSLSMGSGASLTPPPRVIRYSIHITILVQSVYKGPREHLCQKILLIVRRVQLKYTIFTTELIYFSIKDRNGVEVVTEWTPGFQQQTQSVSFNKAFKLFSFK